MRSCRLILISLFFLSLVYWLRAHSGVTGPDFLCYLLNARDLAHGIVPNYFYYPGVYDFWKTSYLLANGDLAQIQWHYLLTVITNGLLVGLILLKVRKEWTMALFGSICYWVLASRSEALYGITEPLGTLPLLATLMIVFPSPVLSLWRLAVLGFGIALGIFMKQQCGLLALGVIGLFLAETDMSIGKRIRAGLARGLFIAAVSVISLIGLFYIEGSGIERILSGLKAVGDYEAQGSFFSHLLRFSNNLRGFFFLFIFVAYSLFAKNRRKNIPHLNLILFCIFAASFSLIQFWKRGYPHYGLIPLPFIVIAVSLTLPFLDWKIFKQHLTATLAAIALYLFISTGVLQSFFKPPPSNPLDSTAQANAICPFLKADADVFVYPAEHNEVHWLCKTRVISSPLSYGWPRIDRKLIQQIISSPTLTAVVLMKNEKQELMDQMWTSDYNMNDLLALLKDRNTKVIDLPNAQIHLFENP